MEPTCARAVELGLSGVAFTEHSDPETGWAVVALYSATTRTSNSSSPRVRIQMIRSVGFFIRQLLTCPATSNVWSDVGTRSPSCEFFPVWLSKLDTGKNSQLGERVPTSLQTFEVAGHVKSWRMKNPTDRIIWIRTLGDELFEVRVVAKISC